MQEGGDVFKSHLLLALVACRDVEISFRVDCYACDGFGCRLFLRLRQGQLDRVRHHYRRGHHEEDQQQEDDVRHRGHAEGFIDFSFSFQCHDVVSVQVRSTDP